MIKTLRQKKPTSSGPQGKRLNYPIGVKKKISYSGFLWFQPSTFKEKQEWSCIFKKFGESASHQ